MLNMGMFEGQCKDTCDTCTLSSSPPDVKLPETYNGSHQGMRMPLLLYVLADWAQVWTKNARFLYEVCTMARKSGLCELRVDRKPKDLCNLL